MYKQSSCCIKIRVRFWFVFINIYRWFHGFLSSVEAERLLERQPVGTYLIRFSKSRSGSFAIGYVDANNRSNGTLFLLSD